MSTQEQAGRAGGHHALPDFVDMMLATGERIGEAAAVTWASLDPDAGTVEIRGTVIRLVGAILTDMHDDRHPGT